MNQERHRSQPSGFLLPILIVTVVAVCGPASAQTSQVLSTPGFGDTNNTGVGATAVFNSMLYVGTFNSTTGTEVWEYDGSGWSQVNSDGFGDANNSITACFAVYGGQLYAGTYNTSSGTEVWRYNGAIWTPVGSGGLGDTANHNATAMAV